MLYTTSARRAVTFSGEQVEFGFRVICACVSDNGTILHMADKLLWLTLRLPSSSFVRPVVLHAPTRTDTSARSKRCYDFIRGRIHLQQTH